MKHSHSKRGNSKRYPLMRSSIVRLLVSCAALLVVFTVFGEKQLQQKSSLPADKSQPSQTTENSAPYILKVSGSPISKMLSRPVYPYSVIPGGVETVKELRKAISNDLTVSQHYAGFRLAKARIIRLSDAREAYVAYRKDNQIYWTKRKLTLPAGETLITDGTQQARTRCGNRISYIPQTPVSAIDPPEKSFENALSPTAFEIPAFAPPAEDAVAPLLFADSESSPTPFTYSNFGAGFPPFGPPINGGTGGGMPSTPGGGGATPSSPSGDPPVATPEPSSALLLAIGLAGIYFSLVRKRVLKT